MSSVLVVRDGALNARVGVSIPEPPLGVAVRRTIVPRLTHREVAHVMLSTV